MKKYYFLLYSVYLNASSHHASSHQTTESADRAALALLQQASQCVFRLDPEVAEFVPSNKEKQKLDASRAVFRKCLLEKQQKEGYVPCIWLCPFPFAWPCWVTIKGNDAIFSFCCNYCRTSFQKSVVLSENPFFSDMSVSLKQTNQHPPSKKTRRGARAKSCLQKKNGMYHLPDFLRDFAQENTFFSTE